MQTYSTQSYFCDTAQNNVCRSDVALAVNCTGIAKVLPAVNASSIMSPIKRNDYYLMYMICGELTASFDSREFVLHSGDFICIPPFTEYCYRCTSEESVKYFWIHFTGRDSAETLSESGIAPLTVSTARAVSENAPLYESLFGEFRSRHPSFLYRTALILRNVLMTLSSQADTEAHQRSALDVSLRYIHTNLKQDLSVKRLAEMEYLSQGYYRSLFKQITGLSPSEYVAEQRVHRACQLLLETDMSIERISEAVGITDRLYFQRFFKKHTGIPPAIYRKRSGV